METDADDDLDGLLCVSCTVFDAEILLQLSSLMQNCLLLFLSSSRLLLLKEMFPRKEQLPAAFETDTLSQDPEASLSQFRFTKIEPIPAPMPLRFFIDPPETRTKPRMMRIIDKGIK